MNDKGDNYTSREDVEKLLQQTRECLDKKKNDIAPGRKMKPSIGKIVRRIVYGLVITALVAMLAKVWIARIYGQVPNLFGYQLYVVETGSMIPNIPIGSTIIVRTLRSDEILNVGDIITYSHASSAITHRIIEIITGEDQIIKYQTKGDNPENSKDPWLVVREDIRGIVIWHFVWPWAGK